MRILLYDCEIKHPIADKKLIRPEPNIVYADGWADFKGMGIALIGAYDYHANLPRLFAEDNLDEFDALARDADLTVSFNGKHFDNPLLAAHGIEIQEDRHYDMYLEVKEAAGAGKFAKGYNLNNCCHINLGLQKSGNAAQPSFMPMAGRTSKAWGSL